MLTTFAIYTGDLVCLATETHPPGSPLCSLRTCGGLVLVPAPLHVQLGLALIKLLDEPFRLCTVRYTCASTPRIGPIFPHSHDGPTENGKRVPIFLGRGGTSMYRNRPLLYPPPSAGLGNSLTTTTSTAGSTSTTSHSLHFGTNSSDLALRSMGLDDW